MKLVKNISLETEITKRLWERARFRGDNMADAYYQGVMTALKWVKEDFEDPGIPLYEGLLEDIYE